jgi:uncharacterized membrane protein
MVHRGMTGIFAWRLARPVACAWLGTLLLCSSSIVAQAQEPPTTYGLTLVTTYDASSLNLTLRGLNEQGEILGNRDFHRDNTETSFVWHNGEFRELNPLFTSANVIASAINNRSAILARYFDQQQQRWRAAIVRGTRVVQIDLRPGELVTGTVDLNDRGQAVVSTLSSDSEGSLFVWKRGVRTPLSAPPGVDFVAAAAINDLGNVVGEASLEQVPLLWQDGTVMVIEPPGGSLASTGQDINNQGVVLLNAFFGSGGPTVAAPLLWQEGMLATLKALPGRDVAHAADVNNYGIAVGFSSHSDPEAGEPPVATIWQQTLPADLNTLIASDDPLRPFVRLSGAGLINDRGQIVASGHDVRDGSFTVGYYLLTPEQ